MAELAYHTLKELPLTERPRERLAAHGEGVLSNAELLAIALGTGSRGQNVLSLSQQLLARFGGLGGVAAASVRELCDVPGVGAAKATQVKAALELGRRLLASGADMRPRISSPADAARQLLADMSMLPQEQLRVMLLDTKNQVLRTPVVYIGNVSSAVVRVGEVFREAIRDNAPHVILAHNHPSGDPEPSAEDGAITQDIVAGGRLLGIDVLDHLVIGRERYVSMRERGLGF